MPAKFSRLQKTLLIATLVVLGIPAIVHGFSFANRPAFVRCYFWVEQRCVDHWPAIQDLAPYAIRAHLLSGARVEVEPGLSFFLDPRDLVSVSILRGGSWQPEVWEPLASSLSEGSVFLDVGAHIGYFSMKAAPRVGASGRVISFEPNPETLQLLRDNVAVDRTDNVIVEPISSARERRRQSGGSARCRGCALTRVDAIKIDVKGAEAMVLQGALNTLKRFHPKIVVEVVPEQLANLHATPEDVSALLRSAGYNHSQPLNEPVTDWEWTVQ